MALGARSLEMMVDVAVRWHERSPGLCRAIWAVSFSLLIGAGVMLSCGHRTLPIRVLFWAINA